MAAAGSKASDDIRFLRHELEEKEKCDPKLMRRLCLYLVHPYADPEIHRDAARAIEELARVNDICDRESLKSLRSCLVLEMGREDRRDEVIGQVNAAIEAVERALDDD
jgi:uncharacterized protein (UPF0216 family)